MKNIYSVLALIILITLSCEEKKEKHMDYAIISGKIINGGSELQITSPDRSSFHKPISLSADGSFLDTLRVNEGAYLLYFTNNVARLYIEKGMELDITADVKDFKNTLSISGNGSEISNYLLEKSKITGELIDYNTLYDLDEDEYKATYNEVKNSIEKVLDTFNGVSDNFKKKEKRNLDYTYLKNIQEYEFLHSRYAKKPDFKVSEGFLAELDDIDYENIEDYNFSESYQDIVVAHFRDNAISLADSKSIPKDLAIIEVLGGINEEEIKNDLLFDFAKTNIHFTNDLENFYADFMAISTFDDHKTAITENYNTLILLLKGNPSPKFENYENYEGGTMSLDDFKGKYVYIDVWATWCGPCIGEIPYLKDIEKKYQRKNIEIVSISVDEPAAYDTWKNMIEEKKLSGTQLLSDNAFASKFIQDYAIIGIPKFILLDPNGDIVDSDAPRPSDPELIELFNELKI